MEHEVEFNLIQSFLNGFNVSTGYRQSSSMVNPCWYYETIVWALDQSNAYNRTDMVYMTDSGRSKDQALKNHFEISRKLIFGEPLESDE